jgi:arylsulfatase A
MTNMDLFPTAAELCGIDLPDREIDGHSLWPIISDAQARTSYEQMHFQWQNQWMAREDKWKLIVNGLDTTGKYSEHEEGNVVMESPFLACLDEEDPELKNHAGEHADVVKRLSQLHDTWSTSVF